MIIEYAIILYYIMLSDRGAFGSTFTANLRTSTKILDLRVFDPSIILMLRDRILMSTGNFPEILSQRILVGIILVGRLGVSGHLENQRMSTIGR